MKYFLLKNIAHLILQNPMKYITHTLLKTINYSSPFITKENKSIMKTLNTILLLTILLTFTTQTMFAQSVTITTNYPNTLTQPNNNTYTISTQLSRSSGDWAGTGNRTWSVAGPGGSTAGVTLSDGTSTGNSISVSGDPAIVLTFTDAAVVGVYTITVTRGTSTATTTVTLTDGSLTNINLWAAKSIDAATSRVETYSVSGLTVNSGPSTLFYTGGQFAAMGRSPYPTPIDGYFYWIPYSAGTNGNMVVMGVNGNGSSPTTVVSSFDIDPASTSSTTFVRFALDKDGIGWTLSGINGQLNLTQIPFNTSAGNGLNTVTPVIIDPDVTLSGGSFSTFNNGDLCLDGMGNIYALANVTGGTTEIYIGQPAGTSTTLTKKWTILNPGGSNFTGSVNGCAFDEFGAMYLTTSTGVYYLDPGTISSTATGGTIQAKLAVPTSNYTDLGTNVFPTSTPLPVVFDDIKGNIINGQLKLTWATNSEVNNDRFEIQVSKDGMNFIKVADVKSKAPNGTSYNKLSYDFSINFDSAQALLGISIFVAAFLLLFINRKNKLLVLVVLIVGTSILGYSCKKDASEKININGADSVFVRIKQINVDGKFEYSKIISVLKAD